MKKAGLEKSLKKWRQIKEAIKQSAKEFRKEKIRLSLRSLGR